MIALTPEQIKAAAGRELAALVAEHLMGRIVLRWLDPPPHEMTLGRCAARPGIVYADGPVSAYSTDGNAMLAVLEKLSHLELDCHIQMRCVLFFVDVCRRGADVEHEGEEYPTILELRRSGTRSIGKSPTE